MITVVETLLFQKQWPLYWTEEERGEFAAFIAERPDAGDVVPGSGGIRKVRWSRAGTGKSGGVRVIYYLRTAKEDLVLLTLYAKSNTDNLTGAKLKEVEGDPSCPRRVNPSPKRGCARMSPSVTWQRTCWSRCSR
jgi:hypothetical protein